MRKYIILVLVFPFLLSCAARKVAVSKTDTKIHIDSTAVEKKDSVSIQKNDIVIKEDSEEIEITPIDTSKPITIGEVKYYNAVVKIKKKHKKTVDKTVLAVAKSSDKKVQLRADISIKKKDKVVDKKQDYSIYIGLFLLIILGVLARKYLPKL